MNDILLNKIPPHDIDIEYAVLSSLFLIPSSFDLIESLSPSDFYRGAHQKIFMAMGSLRDKKEPVDVLTVKVELEENGELESIGGAAYLSMISDEAPVAINIESYAKKVMDMSKARELIQIAQGIVEKGFSGSDIEEYISNSQANILEVQTSTSKDKFFSMSDLMVSAVDRIEQAQLSETILGLKFGMPKLDQYMQNWGSKLILLAGRPGMGKTSLAWSIAINLAFQGEPVGVLSIEMDKEQYADKALSIESDINSMIFYNQNALGQHHVNNLNMAANNLSNLPITINDSEANIDDIKRRCRKFKKMGKKLIVIDQLSQIEYPKGLKPNVGIGQNCTAIKQLTKELRIPILLLSQLNRDLEKRNNKRPILSDLAETGRAEQDSDMILFLYRPGIYDKKIDESQTEINLAKNRQGETGIERQVTFTKNRGMFRMSI